MPAPLTPRTDAYVDSLPDGLKSYADCLIRTDLFETTFRDLPMTRDVPIIVETLSRYRGQKWMPELFGAIINHGMRDACFDSDQAYFEWIEDFNLRIFQRPTYKAIIMLLSTQLLLMGAARKWTSFHQGTQLAIGLSRDRNGWRVAQGELAFPHGLYDELQILTHIHAIRAAMVAARAETPGFELVEIGAGKAKFELSWK